MLIWLTDLTRLVRCLLRGHEGQTVLRPREAFLRCYRCGRRSTGWQLGGPGPTLTCAGERGTVTVRLAVDFTAFQASMSDTIRQLQDRRPLIILPEAERIQ